jgi:large subunit ribosomal protein L29
MSKARELREMSDEQIRLVWKDSAEMLFKLRLQAQTEKLASPSDVRKQRRSIARCQTILAQRGTLVVPAVGPDGVPVAQSEHDAVLHGKHAKKKRAVGRAKIQEPGKAGVAGRRQFKKQTQSGE